MSDLTGIPFVLMRGGTSRGPYFNQQHLPQDRERLKQVLLDVIGSGHPLNIDGIGGGDAVTTKVAILSQSNDTWADIDYFFAQVSVETRLVDFAPTCGNILSGVAAAAVEMGLYTPTGDTTDINIRAVNTGARVTATIQTPNGHPAYHGDARIDGVPGTAAPVLLKFMDVIGSRTGALLPTGNLRDTIDGIEVTCLDVAMPMVIARATDFGLSGCESCAELDNNRDFYTRMESIRQSAGRLMGMGDVSESVTPKFGVLAPARHGGSITARYCMPWKTHPSMAVTGSQCLAVCSLMPGTIADGLLTRGPACAADDPPETTVIEHASGQIEVLVDYHFDQHGFQLQSAGLLRTARKLAAGHVYVPTEF